MTTAAKLKNTLLFFIKSPFFKDDQDTIFLNQNSFINVNLIKKQFKLDKVLQYVEQPNELDEEVDQLKKRVDMLEIILKKEK